MEDLDDLPTTAEWWLTLTGDDVVVWNRMDKEEHVGYVKDGNGGFDAFRGDGLMSDCADCKHKSFNHVIWPEDHIAEADTEHEAALIVQRYAEDVADRVSWVGTPPIHRHGAKHPRARPFMF